MGRDKALLHPPDAEELLWQRQLRVLEELQPQELFWSGPPRPGLPPAVRQVDDTWRSAGPLAGVCACLRLVTTDLLVVLAVDLPLMNAPYLRSLARRCTPLCGAVPVLDDELEPLAAVYPALLHDLAVDRLRQGRYAMRDFAREALRRELLQTVPVSGQDAGKFASLNSLEEVAELPAHFR